VFLAHSPDEFASNASNWAKWLGKKSIAHWLASRSLNHYIIVCLVVFNVLLWLIPYILKRKRKALEIIYDHKNIGRQFREMKTIETFSSHVSGVEYRVKIRNKTDRTLENVKLKSEHLGQMGTLPIRLIFDETKQPTCTLDPNDSAFVSLFFVPLPLFLPGTPTRRSFPSAYGPMRVTVSAKDTKAVERLFHFAPIAPHFDPFKQSLIT
jgi:hypothetical protein